MRDTISAADRRNLIAQMVQEKGQVSAIELREKFDMADTSIWRDLRLLEVNGLLKRVHGGAIALSSNPRLDSFSMKMKQRIWEKERIGLAAAQLIQPKDVCLLDSGSTTLQIIKKVPQNLRQMTPFTLVTNSLPITHEVLSWALPNLVLLGGIYLPDYQASVGPQTLNQLRELTADIVFLGTDGITLEGGVTTANILMAEVDRMMVERSNRAILVTDSSKFGRVGFVPVTSVQSFQTIITDTNAPVDVIDSIRNLGVEVILV
jgi:DeoR/GlpR family transcriptional regulator of sugar metabolism